MKKILLIEDNLLDIELTKEAITDTIPNSLLEFIVDGSLVLEYLHNNSCPDLIILDLNMPKISGKDILKIIKLNPVTRNIPIIIFSTSDSKEEIIQCYNLHANCYIKKPVDYVEFKEILKGIGDFWFSIAILPKGKTNE